jgi:hypothetical protein
MIIFTWPWQSSHGGLLRHWVIKMQYNYQKSMSAIWNIIADSFHLYYMMTIIFWRMDQTWMYVGSHLSQRFFDGLERFWEATAKYKKSKDMSFITTYVACALILVMRRRFSQGNCKFGHNRSYKGKIYVSLCKKRIFGGKKPIREHPMLISLLLINGI